MPLSVDFETACRLERASAMRSVEYCLAYGRLHPEAGSRVEACAGGYLVYTGPSSPVNRAVGMGMTGPVDRGYLDYAREFFRQRGLPLRIDVCPLADPSFINWFHTGCYRLGHFFSVLYRPTAEPSTVAPPEDITITRVDEHTSGQWLRVVGQGFTELHDPPQEDLDILAPNYHGATSVCFMAWIDGEPVGGGAMAVYQGVAEFGGASTRPAFRRRGVQTALLQARLAYCRQAGIELAMVMTEPGSASQSNLERSGFRLAYTRPVLETSEAGC